MSFLEHNKLSTAFPRYHDHGPKIPIWCLTSDLPGCIHRYYDSSSISPSGRYVGLTRFMREDRLPEPGDKAEIILIDLADGSWRKLAETCAWDTQTGAHVQWGGSDDDLYYNDMRAGIWQPFGVRLNPATGQRHEMEHSIYIISRQGSQALSPCLIQNRLLQPGYGVVVPEDVLKAAGKPVAEQGFHLVDLASGRSRLLVSIEQILQTAQPAFDLDRYKNGDFFGAHVKWNPQGTRIMMVLGWRSRQPGVKPLRNLLTMTLGQPEICRAVPDEIWAGGGHHPDWAPDGETIVMNLRADQPHMSFVSLKYDGSELHVLSHHMGSGHPTLHPDGRHLLTDAYVREAAFACGDGTTPLRWLDLETQVERSLARINSTPFFSGPAGEFRVDPHPAWDRTYRWILFNGCVAGSRHVYLADMRHLLADA